MAENYGQSAAYGVGGYPVARTEGVLSRRFFAYLIDIVMMFGLVLILGFAVTLIGFVTFGLAWLLFGILIPATMILYSAATVGGRHQSTIGMRMMGIYVADARTGGRVPSLVAAVHALLFYLATGTLVLIIDVLIGLGRSDRRIGHDLLTNVILLRRA